MGSIRIGRIQLVKDPEIEASVQELATEFSNNLQYGTGTPDADNPGKVYFKHATAASSGWAEVTTVYINTKR